ETQDNALEWFRGDISFSSVNSPMGRVRLAQYEGDGVKIVDGEYAPSLQGYAKPGFALQCRC
ncbi:hypothetical protein DYB37_014006, partial [Aphanomyces astaci]